MNNLEIETSSNHCEIGSNIAISGYVKGHNNTISIDASQSASQLDLKINGNNNTVIIKRAVALRGLSIRIGNHVPANNTTLIIDKGFLIEGGGAFFLYNHNNRLEIGSNCMFSKTITIRCGESPHLLFDASTGEYIDQSEGVFIGDHVWIGEKVYIAKKTTIASESIVAACSVVTRRFSEPHTVLAGNPAKEVKKNVQWMKNTNHIPENSIFAEGYINYTNEINKISE